MASKGEDTIEEQGVTLRIPATKSTAERLKIYNPVLASVREAVLCTLKLECHGRTVPLQCLDAVSNTGLVAMQWKKHLGEAVHVVAAELQTDNFHSNSEQNDQHIVEWPLDNNHRPGDLPKQKQADKEIYVSPQNGNITLHKDAFSFVYLQPNGTISAYIESLFTNLRHGGVACLVSPDISSQCVRSPSLIQRQYHAHVIKTDYLQEMAARVILGAAVKAAARYNKGIEILYTVSLADHFLIAVRVIRKHGEQCMRLCRHVLHCLMCEERVVYPDTHTVIESPYSLLPCKCKESNPGKTAVVLGPMWCGSIFNVPYLVKLKSQVKETFPDSKLNSLLETVVTEAKCERMQISRSSSRQNSIAKSESKEKIVEMTVSDSRKQLDEPVRKKPKLENGDHSRDTEMAEREQNNLKNESNNAVNNGGFVSEAFGPKEDKSGEADTRVQADQKTFTNNYPSASKDEEMPLFYHDLHKKKFHATVLPKSEKLITMLKSKGFRASRTHFDPTAIRTDANVAQMMQVMKGEPVKR